MFRRRKARHVNVPDPKCRNGVTTLSNVLHVPSHCSSLRYPRCVLMNHEPVFQEIMTFISCNCPLSYWCKCISERNRIHTFLLTLDGRGKCLHFSTKHFFNLQKFVQHEMILYCEVWRMYQTMCRL